MNTVTVKDISEQLARNAEAVVRQLLPNAKKQAREMKVGSIHGEPGESLSICIQGNKAGRWSDFAAGDKGGDLVDLWREVRGLSMRQAIQEAKEYLGIRDPDFHPLPQKSYKKPERPTYNKADSVVAYLTHERHLTADTIRAFKVESKRDVSFSRDKMKSDAYYLPSYHEGELVHWKMIGLQRNEKGKKLVTVSPDTKPCLFGWQTIAESARFVVVVEGEIDCMTGYQYGLPCLSVPFGGGAGLKQQWIETEYTNLERFDEIYLCLDQDSEGQTATAEICQRLGAERCKVMKLPHKDLNACLQEGVSQEVIDRCFQNAKPLDPYELKAATDFRDKTLALFYPEDSTLEGYALPWDKTHQNIRLRSGEMSIWSGINGHGKSQMLGHCALEVMKNGGKVCIASMEIKPERQLYRLIRQITTLRQPSSNYFEASMDWLGDKLWLFNVTGTAPWKRILEVFRYARRRYGVDFFIVDSLMKCGIAEDDYKTQKEFIEALCDLKNELDCSIHIVIHPTKQQDESKPIGKGSIKGTGALSDLADNVFTVWRNKPKEDALEKNPGNEELKRKFDAVLGCDKQRNGEWEGKVLLWFDKESFQYLNSQADKPKRYVNYSNSPVTSITDRLNKPIVETKWEMTLTDECS